MIKIKKTIVSMACLLLSGCNLFTPVDTNINKFVLDQVPVNVLKVEPSSANLVVLMPKTSAAYNTKKMAYSTCPHQISYFTKSQWVDTPGQMLNPLLIRTLQDTHYFNTVLSPPFIDNNTFVLRTKITKLIQDYKTKPASLQMRVRTILAKGVSNKIITSGDFFVSVPMTKSTPYAGVLAANRAAIKVLELISKHVIKSSN